jgi:hypothetical protein
MPEIRLIDVYTPLVFDNYIDQNLLNEWELTQSGLIVAHPAYNAMLNNSAEKIEMPYWKEIGTDEPNVSSDDPLVKSQPKKISSDKTIAIRHSNNQSWSGMDLARELTLGTDPMLVLGNKIADYWRFVLKSKLFRTTKGIVLSNIANNGGDMIHNISHPTATDADVTDAQRISAEAMIDSFLTLGDKQKLITHIAVHSLLYGRLQKQNLIQNIVNSEGKIMFQTYLNKIILVDDDMPVFADGFMADGVTPRYSFYSYLWGAGTYGIGSKGGFIPSEIKRDADSGNGAGQETFWSRREFVLSMFGFNWTGAVMAGKSPTYAELENPANWIRKWDRKRIPFAILQSNG